MSRFHVDPQETVDIYEFENEETISDAPPNVITIRARMDVATAGRVSSEMMKLSADNKPELHVGAHIVALLLHNILAWRGPDFDQLPCTPANIRALPSVDGDPFIAKVANEIGTRNRKRESPNSKSPTVNGSASAGGADSKPIGSADAAERLMLRSEHGIGMSGSRSVSLGRQNRSDD